MKNIYLENSISIHKSIDTNYQKFIDSKRNIFESKKTDYSIVSNLLENENKIENIELLKSIINTKNYFEAADFEKHKEFLKLCIKEYKNDNYDVKFTIAQQNPKFHRFAKTLAENFSSAKLNSEIDNLSLDDCRYNLELSGVILEQADFEKQKTNLFEYKSLNKDTKINTLSEHVLLVEFSFGDFFTGVGKKISNAYNFLKNVPLHIRMLTTICFNWLAIGKILKNYKKDKNQGELLKAINNQLLKIETDFIKLKGRATAEQQKIINSYIVKIQNFIIKKITQNNLSFIQKEISVKDLMDILAKQDENISDAEEELLKQENRKYYKRRLHEVNPSSADFSSFSQPTSGINFGTPLNIDNTSLPSAFKPSTTYQAGIVRDTAAPASGAHKTKTDVKKINITDGGTIIVFTGDGEKIEIGKGGPTAQDVKKVIKSEKPPTQEPLSHKLGPDFFGMLVIAWLLMYTSKRLLGKVKQKSEGYSDDQIKATIKQRVGTRDDDFVADRPYSEEDISTMKITRKRKKKDEESPYYLPPTTKNLKIKQKWCYNCGTKNPAGTFDKCASCGADISKQWFTGLASFFTSSLSGILGRVAKIFTAGKRKIAIFLKNAKTTLKDIASELLLNLEEGLYEIQEGYIYIKTKFGDNIIMPISEFIDIIKSRISNYIYDKRVIKITNAEEMIERVVNQINNLSSDQQQAVILALTEELAKAKTKRVTIAPEANI